jgi:hypothetical protein
MQAVRKEIAGIRNQHNQTTFNLREPSDVCILQSQSRPDTHSNSNEQTSEEDCQEDADTFQQTNEA